MQTKELRINKTMRTGVILAVIAVITLIVLAMTFAKYAVQGTGEDSARVAKWGLGTNIPTDLNLFDASYTTTGSTDSSVTVDASDGSNVIASGTSKTVDITLATFEKNEAPEVMYHFEPSITIENDYVSGTTNLTDKIDELPGWNWTLATNGEAYRNYKTVEELKGAVEGLKESDIAPNAMPATKTIQLGWTWAFDYEGASTWDAFDTELGNLIASGQLTGMKITLNLNAYQCQGCSTGPANPQPIVTTIDGQDVVFLPTYSGGTPSFYTTDSTNGWKKIEATDMSTLASAIDSKENAKNV